MTSCGSKMVCVAFARSTALTICLFSTCLAASPKLKVEPPQQASEPGYDVVFHCKYYPDDNVQTQLLEWLLPFGFSVMNMTKSKSSVQANRTAAERFSTEKGKLTIRNASKADDGYYTCISYDGTLTFKARLKIYTMPSYFTEAMVVVSVNGTLIICLLGCFIWTTCSSWKEYKIQENIENNRLADSQ